MDLNLLASSHTIRLILSAGDSPGQSVRALITNEKGQPSAIIQGRIEELVEAGFLACDTVTRRGRDSTAVSLTDRGALVFQLLRAIEKI